MKPLEKSGRVTCDAETQTAEQTKHATNLNEDQLLSLGQFQTENEASRESLGQNFFYKQFSRKIGLNIFLCEVFYLEHFIAGFSGTCIFHFFFRNLKSRSAGERKRSFNWWTSWIRPTSRWNRRINSLRQGYWNSVPQARSSPPRIVIWLAKILRR